MVQMVAEFINVIGDIGMATNKIHSIQIGISKVHMHLTSIPYYTIGHHLTMYTSINLILHVHPYYNIILYCSLKI